MTPIKIRIDDSDYDLYPDRIVNPNDPAACYLAVKQEIQLQPQNTEEIFVRAFDSWPALEAAIEAVQCANEPWHARIDAILQAAVKLVDAAQGPRPRPELVRLRDLVEGCEEDLACWEAHKEALVALAEAGAELEKERVLICTAALTLEVLS